MQNFRGLTRREFLKLISLVPLGIHARPLKKLARAAQNASQKNVIIIVFDAWSQHHVPLYGYPRPTMPSLDAFVEKATVYHNHYSTGTFTVPGTASILTGMHPWTHRAFQLGAGVASAHAGHTIFSALEATHSTLAYTQNKFADQFLYQAEGDLDHHVPNWIFNAQDTNLYGASIFEKDPRIAFASFNDNIVQRGEGFDSTLFFGPLYRMRILTERQRNIDQYSNIYPRGLPDSAAELFLLPDIVDGAISLLKEIEQPTLTYFHFYPPHEPYTPTTQFFDSYKDDGFTPTEKPTHDLSEKKYKFEKLRREHRYYDEFLNSWDLEVARLFQYLKDSGLTENSYIIITSDHGELFERGDLGHWTKLIFDSVVHVPLMVLSPGQTARQDVHSLTSSVDLLPTIAQLTGNPIPEWAEGKPLPRLGGEEDQGRSIFSMDAKMNSSFAPLRNYSMSLTRDGHRLVHYSYPKDGYEKYEFYALNEDRDELKDLYPSKPALAKEMQDELLQKLEEVNNPFRKDGED